MAGLAVALCAVLAVWGALAIATKRRRRREIVQTRRPGQLSAAERRRLYQRLGINPATLARQSRTNVIWLDVTRRTDA